MYECTACGKTAEYHVDLMRKSCKLGQLSHDIRETVSDSSSSVVDDIGNAAAGIVGAVVDFIANAIPDDID